MYSFKADMFTKSRAMLCHVIIMLCLCLYANCEYLQLAEGAECSWKGVKGQCVSVYKCLSSIRDIEEKNYPPICMFQGTAPVICCTDCELVDDTRLLLIDRALGFLRKTGKNKAKDKCLDYIHEVFYPCKMFKRFKQTKILNSEKNCHEIQEKHQGFRPAIGGGRNALRREYPHMALLGYGNSVETADWLCGGSVISERFILTAAHCISTPDLGPVKYIALGILKRTDPSSLWQTYNVSRVIPHPQYQSPSKYHDIALLETDKEITFNDQVRPACLHVDEDVDEKADATGWGALGNHKSLADVLQSVSLHKFSEEECSRYYPSHRHLMNGYNNSIQMCYGDTDDPKDTCGGDSGGPLQSIYHQRCVYTILGVTSFGRKCGVASGSGMYTRVYHYVPWIESIVWP